MKITIIGTGNIGSAVAIGLSKSNITTAEDITCSDLKQENLDKILAVEKRLKTTVNACDAIHDADIIIIAVKPWMVEKSINQIKEHLNPAKQIIISFAAGIDFIKMSRYFEINGSNEKTPALFRVTPNIAIEVQSSLTFISSFKATAQQEEMVISVFNQLGSAILIDEGLMAAGTALASCGIAFALRYIRAATEGGVEMGFYPEQARKIVVQTVKGAVDLLNAHNTNPETEIDRVTTPGGITIRGLNKMEEEGFSSAIIKGLKASR
ncbi:MAG: pyrroline-5-carboxylate reductase dimerization domain-containing protein [Bacteroidales bacterium]